MSSTSAPAAPAPPTATTAPPAAPAGSPDPVALLAEVLARVASMAATSDAVAPEALTIADAAKFCGVSPSMWRSLDSRGLCPAPIQIGDGGRCPRWVKAELIAWLRNGAVSRVRWQMMRDSVLPRKVG